MKLELSALKTFLVLNKDGSVDHAASHNKLTAAISEYELRMRDDDGLAARAVGAVFDKYRGQEMSINSLVSFAMGTLQVTDPDHFRTLDTAIRRYLKSNTGARPSLFGSSPGKGTWRWSDQAADKK